MSTHPSRVMTWCWQQKQKKQKFSVQTFPKLAFRNPKTKSLESLLSVYMCVISEVVLGDSLQLFHVAVMLMSNQEAKT